MNRNRFALILGVLVCLTGAVAAFDVTETTDYPGGFSFTSNPSVGTLDPGSNTVSGSLSGNCVTTSSTLIDCNPGTVATGDTQDSFLLTVPTGYRMTSLTVTTSAVSSPRASVRRYRWRVRPRGTCCSRRSCRRSQGRPPI